MTDKLASAEALLNNLTGESPLQLRLAKELAELKGGSSSHKKVRSGGR
jgi:hypothetical protein